MSLGASVGPVGVEPRLGPVGRQNRATTPTHRCYCICLLPWGGWGGGIGGRRRPFIMGPHIVCERRCKVRQGECFGASATLR